MANSSENQQADNIIQISVNDFNKLHGAKLFSKVPLSIVDYFHKKDISIDGSAKVLKHLTSTEWFIIDKKTPFWQFFYLKVGKRARNNFPLTIERETADYNNAEQHKKIAEVGIVFQAEQGGIFEAEESEATRVIDQKQQQKIDYFFRTKEKKSPLRHERTIYKIAAWRDVYYKKFNISIAKVGLFVIISLFLILQTWAIIAIPAILYVGYNYFKPMFIEFLDLYKSDRIVRQALKTLEQEREILAVTTSLPLVSDKQMEAWLDEEIKTIDRTALQQFQLSKPDIIPADKNLKNRATVGLNIEEWALHQPLRTLGKKAVSTKHSRAFKFGRTRPLYGVYYIVLFYLTDDAICIFSCFYDFIKAKKIGTTTKKLRYPEVARIEMKIDNSKIQDTVGLLETQQVVFHFYNSDSLTIALTNPLAIANLRAKIEGQPSPATIESPAKPAPNPTNNPALKKLFALSEKQLAGTRHSLILSSIHYFWNYQKLLPQAKSVQVAEPVLINKPTEVATEIIYTPPIKKKEVIPQKRTINERFRYV